MTRSKPKAAAHKAATATPSAAAAPPPPPPAAEPMRAVDRAWLDMDSLHNPMVMSSVMEFEGAHDVRGLAGRLLAPLLCHPRFRQRVVEEGGDCAWLEDDELHLGYHVQTHFLGPRATDAELRAAIAASLQSQLDRALPLWRLTLFLRDRGRVTALFRVHHALGDGIAMMQLLPAMADGGAIAAPAAEAPAPAAHGPLGGLIHNLEAVNGALENLGEIVADDLRHPEHFAEQVSGARRAVAAVARVVTLPDDNPRQFRKPLSGHRAVAWTGELSFRAIRALARAQGVTINDVLLAALAGAFGRVLRAEDEHLSEQQNLRISVPVNLRTNGDTRPGNRFGLVLLDLPVGLEGWHARLDMVSERMAALKQSPEARAIFGALAAAGHLPAAAEKYLVNFVGGKAAAVVSNLPGPRRPITIAGAKLVNMVFWPPQAARVGIGVSFLSYAGRITIGISADTAHVARPQQVIDALREDLEAILGHPPARRAAPRRRRATSPSTARSATGVHHAER